FHVTGVQTCALPISHQDLVAISRSNLSSQSRIHAGVLSLLGARSFGHLIDIITNELSHTLGCEAVTLCVEGDGHTLPRAIRAGLDRKSGGQGRARDA